MNMVIASMLRLKDLRLRGLRRLRRKTRVSRRVRENEREREREREKERGFLDNIQLYDCG